MELKVLGSSSSGNCYILDNGREALIIEAGVGMQPVKKALDYNLKKVVGCIVTHAHNDHAKFVRNMLEYGFHVLALPEMWEAKPREKYHRHAVAIKPNKGYKLGRFKVMPFSVMHDVPCVGYFIEHPDCGRIMFLTDSCDCPRVFNGLSHILIECNYSTPNLMQAIKDGNTLKSQMERLPNSHMELQTCKAILSEFDLSHVQEIVLLHLSKYNSDEPRFVSEIQRTTGKGVYVAKPGLKLDITKF